MRRAARVALAAFLLADLAGARDASAQTPRPPRRPRLEASIGGLWIGGAALGSEPAELRANRVPPGPFTLFTTDTDSIGAAGIDARVAWWLTPTIAVEGGLVRVEPELRTRIAGDAEAAEGLTVAERLDQYFIDARVVWLIERFRFRGRTVPFVSGGAGYLRQLHEGRTLIETGQVYNAGGGLRHVLRQRDAGLLRLLGVRLDGRVYVLVDGVQFEDRPRTHGAVTASMFVTF